MEQRAKSYLKKSLGVVMALVMIFSSVSAAVLAANPIQANFTQADKDNEAELRAAFKAAKDNGALAEGKWDYTTPADASANPASGTTTMTINDTSGGYIFKVAQAYAKAINSDNITAIGDSVYQTSADGPYTWWSRLTWEYGNYLGLNSTPEKALMSALNGFKTPGESVVVANNKSAAFSKDGDPAWLTDITRATNLRVTVNWNELESLKDFTSYQQLLDYLALNPSGVPTQLIYGIDGARRVSGANSWNYFGARFPTVVNGTRTETDKLIAYHTYFFNGLMDTNPFEMGPGPLATLIANNTTVRNSLSAFSAADIEKFFPNNQEVVDFVKSCTEASDLSIFTPAINYFHDPVTGFIAEIYSNGDNHYYDPDNTPANKAVMDALWSTMQAQYNFLMDVSPKGKIKLAETQGLNLAEIDVARAILRRDMDLIELPSLKDEIDANYSAWFRTSNEFGRYDYEAAELAALVTAYEDFFTRFQAYKEPEISEIFDEGPEYFLRFRDELLREAKFNELSPSNTPLAEAIRFFADVLASDLTKKDTKELYDPADGATDMLEQAQYYSDIFFQEYDAYNAVVAAGPDKATLFGDYPVTIQQAIDKIYDTLEGRITAQVQNAVSLYDNETTTVNWNNVSLIRSMVGRVEPSIYSLLNPISGRMSAQTRADYARLNSSILAAFNAFCADGGYHSYLKTTPADAVRSPFEEDLARVTPEDYTADHDALETVFKKLEEFLKSDTFKTLTNLDIEATIEEILEGLWSDDIINAIVGLLYDAVLNEFENLWGSMPASFTSVDDDPVNGDGRTSGTLYLKDLYGVLSDVNPQFQGNSDDTWYSGANTLNDLKLYPDLLAKSLPTQYTEAVAAMNAVTIRRPPSGGSAEAKFDNTNRNYANRVSYPTNAWKNPAIYEAGATPDDAGKLTIKWGVTDEADTDWLAMPEYGGVMPSKEERFKAAFSAAMRGIWPLMAALLAGQSYKGTHPGIASLHGKDWSVSSNMTIRGRNISLNLDVPIGTNGYAEIFTPIFETLLGNDPVGLALVPEVGLDNGSVAGSLKAMGGATGTGKSDAATGTRALVNAIFEPLLYFVREKAVKEPLDTVAKLLPNAAYALAMDNIVPLLANLKLNLAYKPTGGIAAYCLGCWVDGVSTVEDAKPDLAGDVSIDVMQLAGGALDLSMLGDMQSLMDMISQPLLGISLPAPNAGRFATLGELKKETDGYPTKRPSGTRYYVEADREHVLLELLRYVGTVAQDTDTVEAILDMMRNPKQPEDPDEPRVEPMDESTIAIIEGVLRNVARDPDNAAAALVELFVAQDPKYAIAPHEYKTPNFATPYYPDWWNAQSPEDAKSHGQYLIENADAVINVIWQELLDIDNTGFTFGQQVTKLLKGLVLNNNPATTTPWQPNFQWMAQKLKSIINELITKLDDFLLANPDTEPLLTMLIEEGIYVDDVALNLRTVISDFLLYDETAANVSSVQTFIDALAEALVPLAPVLDFLLAGQNIELIEAGTEGGLLEIPGGKGYESFIVPLMKALADPLGVSVMDGATWDALPTATPADIQAKYAAALAPLVGIYDKVVNEPVDSLLSVIPNLLYFLADIKQPLDKLLNPLYVLVDTARPIVDIFGLVNDILGGIEDFEMPEGIAINPDGVNIDVIGLLNNVANNALSGLDTGPLHIKNIDLNKFILGENGLAGWTAGDTYVKADKPALLFALLETAGVLDLLDESGWSSLTYIIKYNKIPGSEQIFYANAPRTSAVVTGAPSWFKQEHSQFLVDNVDAVINWAWSYLMSKPAVKTDLERLLGDNVGFLAGASLQPTLPGTVDALLGDYAYTPENLTAIVDLILGFKGTVDGLHVDLGWGRDITLAAALKSLLQVGGQAIDLDAMFANFAAYVEPASIADAEDFIDRLANMLVPVTPLLNLFFAGEDATFINDPSVAGGGGLIKLYGYNGYEFGILPLLLALGADVDGYIAEVMPAAAFAAETDAGRIKAVIKPILFLLNKVAEAPVDTIMRMVPNLAYVLSNANGISVAQQAIERFLNPVLLIAKEILPDAFQTELIDPLLALDFSAEAQRWVSDELGKNFVLADFVTGAISEYNAPFNAIGIDNGASFVKMNKRAMANLLTQLLVVTGALDALEDAGFEGVVKFLGDQATDWPEYITYPLKKADSVKYNFIWAKGDAKKTIVKAEATLNALFEMIYGKPFGTLPAGADSFLKDIFGEKVFTDANFNSLLNLIKDKIPAVENMKLLGDLTLGQVIKDVVSVDGVPFDGLKLLNHLKTWTPAVKADGKDAFLNALAQYLEGVMPLLDVVLCGKDLVVLDGEATINSANGFMTVPGYEGYKYGLVPILEMFLKPLGKESSIPTDTAFVAMSANAKAKAVINCVGILLDEVTTKGLSTLLKVLPNLAYNIKGQGGVSPLTQAISRILLPVNNVLEVVGGAIGIDPISVDVYELLEGVFSLAISDKKIKLSDFGITPALFDELMLGVMTPYKSAANGDPNAKYIKGDTELTADVVTVILRTVITVLQDKKMRNAVLDLLSDTIGLKGFAKTLVKWHLGLMLWFSKWLPFGTDLAARSVLRWMGILKFFAPVINWFLKIFGVIK